MIETLDALNFHHLRYFWAVATRGSVAAASRELRVSQPTVSAQVKALERALAEPLFERAGRGLALTDTGCTVLAYAEQIFSLGREMLDTLRHHEARPQRLTVGLADVVPKLVAQRLLEPLVKGRQPIHLICREDRAEVLEAELAIHGVDVVISDAPLPPQVKVQAYSHLLGQCSVDLFAMPGPARRLRRGFPASLDGADMLLPTTGNDVRIQMERWFRKLSIRPRIVGEFDDSALMKVFGQTGAGVFPAPAIIARELKGHYGVVPVGTAGAVRERFYAITLERRLEHPAVQVIHRVAREKIFV